MSLIGKPERATQDRVRTLLRDELQYDDLGTWADRGDLNSHIEEPLLTQRHAVSGYSPAQVGMAPRKLRTEVRHPNRLLAASPSRPQGDQEPAPERAAARGPGANRRTVAHDARHPPRVRDFAPRMDQGATAQDAPPSVALKRNRLPMQVRPGADAAACRRLLDARYRAQVQAALPAIVML